MRGGCDTWGSVDKLQRSGAMSCAGGGGRSVVNPLQNRTLFWWGWCRIAQSAYGGDLFCNHGRQFQHWAGHRWCCCKVQSAARCILAYAGRTARGSALCGGPVETRLSVSPQFLIDFLKRASSACQTILEGVRINPFGHLGDRNVHDNLPPPIGQKGFSGQKETSRFRLGRLGAGDPLRICCPLALLIGPVDTGGGIRPKKIPEAMRATQSQVEPYEPDYRLYPELKRRDHRRRAPAQDHKAMLLYRRDQTTSLVGRP